MISEHEGASVAGAASKVAKAEADKTGAVVPIRPSNRFHPNDNRKMEPDPPTAA